MRIWLPDVVLCCDDGGTIGKPGCGVWIDGECEQCCSGSREMMKRIEDEEDEGGWQ